MKEYKILKQKVNLLKNTDEKFETQLNLLAREGWRVITAVTDQGNMGLKVILERDKNR
ncbi:DUF4177 domain-containing protein [uncultured Kriegella sp.]|uniref:DUF4177 domain-containing protein n=1 Tax=uncultured Kriegella sp. TaxID=1798910 RepID=UPI0030DCAA31|tara:strand:- start:9533 stop:9706 length:174 start_codon:yes stop_codon:yes gene_type:complete